MVNKVILVGNLGRDAELRYTPGGAAVSTFSVATTETWKDREGAKQERTEWHRVVLWGKAAEAVNEYLTKGKQVYVEGSLQTRKWEDKDGNERHTTEVKARELKLLGGGRGRGSDEAGDQRRRPSRGNEAADDDAGPMEPITDDDIPFVWLMPLIGAGLGLLHAVLGSGAVNG